MSVALSHLTTRGRAFLSAGVTSAACAIVLGQRDLLRIGVMLIALPTITLILMNRTRYLLSCSREIRPSRVETGQPAVMSFELRNPGRLATGLMLLEDNVPYVLGTRPRFVIDQLRPRWHRAISYNLRSEVRGRYLVGPMSVRLGDPFGFVEVVRSFSGQATLIVTPAVTELPMLRLTGDWSGSGDSRPRAFASAGTEDVMVREYRLGDDLRRIHWPSTARVDELMVRREEQPHQSRATLILDTRTIAHRGSGATSSFEYAVCAAASVGAHLATQMFAVRLVTDSTASPQGGWHDRGIGGHAEIQLMLDSLAVVSTRMGTELTSRNQDMANGLVVAVLGSLTTRDVAALSRLASRATRALAIVLDVSSWAREEPADGRLDIDLQVAGLRTQGWAVAVARPSDRIDAVWRMLADDVPVTASSQDRLQLAPAERFDRAQGVDQAQAVR